MRASYIALADQVESCRNVGRQGLMNRLLYTKTNSVNSPLLVLLYEISVSLIIVFYTAIQTRRWILPSLLCVTHKGKSCIKLRDQFKMVRQRVTIWSQWTTPFIDTLEGFTRLLTSAQIFCNLLFLCKSDFALLLLILATYCGRSNLGSPMF